MLEALFVLCTRYATPSRSGDISATAQMVVRNSNCITANVGQFYPKKKFHFLIFELPFCMFLPQTAILLTVSAIKRM